MQDLLTTLQSKSVVYVTRDIERAIGLPLSTEGYFIISNAGAFAKTITKKQKNVLLIKEDEPLDTRSLLQHPLVKRWIANLKEPKILVFKNTKEIERLCAKAGWCLLNPSAILSDLVEPKLSQIPWLGDLARYLPKYTIKQCKDIIWKGTPFVMQFNHSHTGSGTMRIDSSGQLENVRRRFPKRKVRIARYIDGPLYTNNNCVLPNSILLGNISYQITGLYPFTDRPFATIGNDWALPKKTLSLKQRVRYAEIATKIGEKLRMIGWKGLFGIDTVVDRKTGKIYLLEINCRQPASTSYESILQRQARDEAQTESITIFEAHLSSLLEISLSYTRLTTIQDGAQIIQRVPEAGANKQFAPLQTTGFTIIPYENKNPGADSIRIQSLRGIMAEHNEWNEVGEKIIRCIS